MSKLRLPFAMTLLLVLSGCGADDGEAGPARSGIAKRTEEDRAAASADPPLAAPVSAAQAKTAGPCDGAPGASCGGSLTCNAVKACACGNGAIDPGEECDTADPNLRTSCTNACKIPCVDGETCTPQQGRRGVVECTTGSRVCKDIGPAAETCGDELDNDANGAVDDGCVVRVTVSPYPSNNGYNQPQYVPCYGSTSGYGGYQAFDPQRYCKSKKFSSSNGKWKCTTLGNYGGTSYVEWVECVR